MTADQSSSVTLDGTPNQSDLEGASSHDAPFATVFSPMNAGFPKRAQRRTRGSARNPELVVASKGWLTFDVTYTE